MGPYIKRRRYRYLSAHIVGTDNNIEQTQSPFARPANHRGRNAAVRPVKPAATTRSAGATLPSKRTTIASFLVRPQTLPAAHTCASRPCSSDRCACHGNACHASPSSKSCASHSLRSRHGGWRPKLRHEQCQPPRQQQRQAIQQQQRQPA